LDSTREVFLLLAEPKASSVAGMDRVAAVTGMGRAVARAASATDADDVLHYQA
jgi:hypothetical protein